MALGKACLQSTAMHQNSLLPWHEDGSTALGMPAAPHVTDQQEHYLPSLCCAVAAWQTELPLSICCLLGLSAPPHQHTGV